MGCGVTTSLRKVSSSIMRQSNPAGAPGGVFSAHVMTGDARMHSASRDTELRSPEILILGVTPDHSLPISFRPPRTGVRRVRSAPPFVRRADRIHRTPSGRRV